MKLSKAHNLRALCNGIEIKKRGKGTKEKGQEPGSVALLSPKISTAVTSVRGRFFSGPVAPSGSFGANLPGETFLMRSCALVAQLSPLLSS